MFNQALILAGYLAKRDRARALAGEALELARRHGLSALAREIEPIVAGLR